MNSENWGSASKSERGTEQLHSLLNKNFAGYKMLADVLEAVIGAFHIDTGIEAAANIINSLGVVPISYICQSMSTCLTL